MTMCRVNLIGNLGKDPELRYTPQGTAVGSFVLAHNTKVGGEKVTYWWKVTLWRQLAELAAQRLHKGDSVYVSGDFELEKWTDKKGKEGSTLCVTANDLQFLNND